MISKKELRASRSPLPAAPRTTKQVPSLEQAAAPPERRIEEAPYIVTEYRKPRRGRGVLGFLLVVVLPTLLAAYYYVSIQKPQYESEFRFGVRSVDSFRNDATAVFQGMAAASQIGLDSYVIVQFIKSHEMVDSLSEQFDFRKLFSGADIDWVSRLRQPASAEETTAYWQGMVDPYFDLTTGSVTVRVRAFDPETAKRLAESIVARSEKLINDISERIRRDAMGTAQAEVKRSEERMREVLASMKTFRDTQGRIDPAAEAQGGLRQVETLTAALANAKAQLEVQQSYMSDTSPALVVTKNKVKALQRQLDEAQNALTEAGIGAKNNASLSSDIGSFDALAVDQKIAEENYATAKEALEKARVQAERQVSYLTVFVHPSLPQEPAYPKVLQSIAIAAAVALGIWIFLVIMIKSVREHW
jgi:capsular polysaccharide transport system permease protein